MPPGRGTGLRGRGRGNFLIGSSTASQGRGGSSARGRGNAAKPSNTATTATRGRERNAHNAMVKPTGASSTKRGNTHGTPRAAPTGLSWSDRYHALTKARERERADAVRKGIIADPEKPRLLSEAVTPVGTCQDMCAEYERVERVVQNDVWDEEKDLNSSSGGADTEPDESRMVKKFRRAAAGLEEQLPSDLRPPQVLKRTCDYLFEEVIGNASSLASVHHFVWDRTRAVRNDFSIQQLVKLDELQIAIDCYERIARFHIVSLHLLAVPEKPYAKYDGQQEREQLDRTLLSLMQYYDDCRGRIELKNEAEFRSYCVVFQLQDPTPDLEDRIQAWPIPIIQDARVQTAVQLYMSACNVKDSQGPLKPRVAHLIARQDWQAFWSLVSSNRVSYLMACVAEIYFGLVRRTVLNALFRTFRSHSTQSTPEWTTDVLCNLLAFDDGEHVIEFCEAFGFDIKHDEQTSKFYLDLSTVSGRTLPEPKAGTMKQGRTDLVETKRHSRSIPAVINGMTVSQAQAAGLIEEYDESADMDEDAQWSENEEQETAGEDPDSLFVPESKAKINVETPKPTAFGSNPFAKSPFNNTGFSFGKPSQSSVTFDLPESGDVQTKTSAFTTPAAGSTQSSATGFSFLKNPKQPISQQTNSGFSFSSAQTDVAKTATTTPSASIFSTSAPKSEKQSPFVFGPTNVTSQTSPFASQNPSSKIGFGKPSTGDNTFSVSVTPGASPSFATPFIPSHQTKPRSNLLSPAAEGTSPKPSTSPFSSTPSFFSESTFSQPKPISSSDAFSMTAPANSAQQPARDSKPQSPFPVTSQLPNESASKLFTTISPVSQGMNADNAVKEASRFESAPKSQIDTLQQKPDTMSNTPPSTVAPAPRALEPTSPSSNTNPGGKRLSISADTRPKKSSPLINSFTVEDDTAKQSNSNETHQMQNTASLFADKVTEPPEDKEFAEPSKNTEIATVPPEPRESFEETVSRLAIELMNDPIVGFLKQYVEFAVSKTITAAQIQHIQDQDNSKADEFRKFSLALRFGKRWLDGFWRRRLAKSGRERRQRRRRMLDGSSEYAESHTSGRARSSVAGTPSKQSRPSISKREEVDQMFKETIKSKYSPLRSGFAIPASPRSADKPAGIARDQLGHKRLKSASHVDQRGRITKPATTNHSQNDILRRSSFLGFSRSPETGPSKNTTSTNYFRLKALGLAPTSQPRGMKRRYSESEHSAARKSTPGFLWQSPRASQDILSPIPRPSEAVSHNGVDNMEALLARARLAREMLNEGREFFRSEIEKDKEMRQSVVSQSSNYESPSMSQARAAARAKLSNTKNGSIAGSQDIPAYRLRESKFVPREHYDRAIAKANELRASRSRDTSRPQSRVELYADPTSLAAGKHEQSLQPSQSNNSFVTAHGSVSNGFAPITRDSHASHSQATGFGQNKSGESFSFRDFQSQTLSADEILRDHDLDPQSMFTSQPKDEHFGQDYTIPPSMIPPALSQSFRAATPPSVNAAYETLDAPTDGFDKTLVYDQNNPFAALANEVDADAESDDREEEDLNGDYPHDGFVHDADDEDEEEEEEGYDDEAEAESDDEEGASGEEEYDEEDEKEQRGWSSVSGHHYSRKNALPDNNNIVGNTAEEAIELSD